MTYSGLDERRIGELCCTYSSSFRHVTTYFIESKSIYTLY